MTRMSGKQRAERRGAPKKPKPAPGPMRNRFAGKCDCGRMVASGAGIVKLVDGMWAPFHLDCAGEKVDIKPITQADRVRLAAKLVAAYAASDNSPHFGPKDGVCFHCRGDLMAYLGEKYGDRPITGCPICSYSYCE